MQPYTLMRNLMLVALLLMSSACRCWFFCYDDTSIQRNYVGDRNDCQDDAEFEVGYFSGFTMNERERNAKLLQAFAKCMQEKNWGVSKPKVGSKTDEQAALEPRPSGIPPGDIYTTRSTRQDDTQAQSQTQTTETLESTTVERDRQTIIREGGGQPARRSVNRNVVVNAPSGQESRQPVVNNYYIYQTPQQQQQMQRPMVQQPAPQPIPQPAQPRVIERQIIREVPVQRSQPAPQTRVIERQVIQQVPVQTPQMQASPAAPPVNQYHYYGYPPATAYRSGGAAPPPQPVPQGAQQRYYYYSPPPATPYQRAR